MLPPIADLNSSRYQIYGGAVVRGQSFIVYPGVNDNDSIHDPGVASRLGWLTILPRDEAELFRNFTASDDWSDYLVMQVFLYLFCFFLLR